MELHKTYPIYRVRALKSFPLYNGNGTEKIVIKAGDIGTFQQTAIGYKPTTTGSYVGVDFRLVPVEAIFNGQKINIDFKSDSAHINDIKPIIVLDKEGKGADYQLLSDKDNKFSRADGDTDENLKNKRTGALSVGYGVGALTVIAIAFYVPDNQFKKVMGLLAIGSISIVGFGLYMSNKK
jgi:hypothetical protein